MYSIIGLMFFLTTHILMTLFSKSESIHIITNVIIGIMGFILTTFGMCINSSIVLLGIILIITIIPSFFYAQNAERTFISDYYEITMFKFYKNIIINKLKENK